MIGPSAAAFVSAQRGASSPLPLDLYWDSVDGSDANDGRTPASPIQTRARLAQLLPERFTRPVAVHLASGAYDLTPPLPSMPGATNALMLICDGCAIDGGWDPRGDARAVVASGAADVGTNGNQCVTALATAADQFQGYTIRFTSGAAVGQRRLLNQHPIGAVFPTLAWSPAPAPGDTFEVFNSNAVIGGQVLTYDNPGWSSAIVGTSAERVGVAFVGVDIDSAIGGATKILGPGYFSNYGVRFRTGAQALVLKAGGFEMGIVNGQNLSNQFPGLPQSSWGGWGVAFVSTNSTFNTRAPTVFLDGFVVTAGALGSMRGTQLIRGGCARTIGLNSRAIDVTISGPSAALPFVIGGVNVPGTVVGATSQPINEGCIRMSNCQIRQNGTGLAAVLLRDGHHARIDSTVIQGSMGIGNVPIDNPGAARTIEVVAGGLLVCNGAFNLGRTAATDIFCETVGQNRGFFVATAGAGSAIVDPANPGALIRRI